MRTLHKIWVIALLVITICFPSVVTVSAVETENTWTRKASIPQTDFGMGAAALNGKIYVMGGTNNFEYNPAADSWVNKTSVPTPRFSFAIAAYQDKIYVLGGDKKSSDALGVNEVYDPLTDTWQTLKPLLSNVTGKTGNVVDGKIFLFSDYLNQVYDIATDSWTTKSPMPYPSGGYSSAVVNDKIYVMGGWKSGKNVNQTQIYDPKTDTWTLGAPSPLQICSAACAATTGVMAPKRIYAIGGSNGIFDSVNTVSVYDPIANNWTIGAPMPTPRQGATAAVVNDKIYVFAGAQAVVFTPPSDVTEQYTPLGYGTPDPNYGTVPEFGSSILMLLFVSVTAASILTLKMRKKRLI